MNDLSFYLLCLNAILALGIFAVCQRLADIATAIREQRR